LLIYSICAQCRPVSSFKFLEKMNGEAEVICICAEAYISIEGRATQHGKDPTMAILIHALSNVTFDECKGLLEMGDKKQARSFFNEGLAKNFIQTMLVSDVLSELPHAELTSSLSEIYYRRKHTNSVLAREYVRCPGRVGPDHRESGSVTRETS
jgi:DNA topoisomerase VI subunit A